MTDEEILARLAPQRFVALGVVVRGVRVYFGPGEATWRHDLAAASRPLRAALEAKICAAKWLLKSA